MLILDINPCDTENGECEYKCVHVGHEKYECLCDDGFELNADKHSCDSKYKQQKILIFT